MSGEAFGGNIFKEGELDRNSVYAKNAYTASDGKTYQVAFYNLEVVISVGYRVKSVQGTCFRQWATGVLKEYLIRGYAVNTRLNQLEDKMNRRLAKHDSDIADLKEKVDFIVQTQTCEPRYISYTFLIQSFDSLPGFTGRGNMVRCSHQDRKCTMS